MSMDNSCALSNLSVDSESTFHVKCPGGSDDEAESLRDTYTRSADEESSAGVRFFPPLYIQRYTLVLTCLTQHSIRSMVDFGCSECTLVKLLPTVSSLQEIALVDIDRDLLQSKKQVIEPELRHYIYRRHQPLHVMLMAGSAEVTDSRLLNYDAVTLIEIIEHLEAKVLESVTHNVFCNMAPKLCVVTTPNSEFNILFDNHDPKQFRHWDHKFEWTQQEFHQWCEQVCQKYNYLVEYSGVGRLPSRPDTYHLGPCSQAAIFTLQQQQERKVSRTSWPQSSVCYELIAESYFPFEKDVLSLEEKIDLEVSYCLRQMVISCRDSVNQGEPINIRIADLARLYTVRNLCDENGVRESLHRCKHILSPDGLFVVLEDDGWPVDEEDTDEIENTCHELSESRSELDHQQPPGVECEDSSKSNSEHTSEEEWDIQVKEWGVHSS